MPACADSAGRPGRGAPRSPRLPPAIAHHSPPSNRPMDRPARFAPAGTREDRGQKGAPPATRRRWWPCDTTQPPQCKARPRSDALTGRFDVVVARAARPQGALLHPNSDCTARARQGSVVAMSWQAHRRTERCHARRAARLRAHVAPRTPQPAAALQSRAVRLSSGLTLRADCRRAHRRGGFFPEPCRPPNFAGRARSPSFAVLESFGFGRPRKPMPTCQFGYSRGTKLRVL